MTSEVFFVMQNKKCPKCKETKPFECFGKNKRSKSGLQVYCNSCRSSYRKENKERIKAKNKSYREANKEKISARKKEWYEANKEHVKKRDKKYYEANKEKINAYCREHYNKNKKKHMRRSNAYVKNRYATDPVFKTMLKLRSQVKRLGNHKNDSTIKIVGCSPKEFWEMNGSPTIEEMKTLHIDHIVPLSWFDLENEHHVIASNHYTNLQYLKPEENLTKLDTYAGSPDNIIARKGDFDINAHVQKTLLIILERDIVVVL